MTREEANKILNEAIRGPYYYLPNPARTEDTSHACLDGDFTLDELKAVIFLWEHHPEDLYGKPA